MQKLTIINITGTKGKTTISRLLNHIFIREKRPTLLVDTDGHYLNGKIKGTMEDSKNLYGLVPTVCPGRFLYELKGKDRAIAILETAVGSSGPSGIGYDLHDIGIFTNVFEDHIGVRIKNRVQLASEKSSYVFARIAPRGVAIFNADDKYICSRLIDIPAHRNVKLLPVGLSFKFFNIKSHLAKGGLAISIKEDYVGVLAQKKFVKLINLKDVYWTFEGIFTPSVYNLMFAVAALFAENNFKRIKKPVIENILNYQMGESGGRLTLYKNEQKDIRVLVDYAHEKYSLRQVAKLAKKLSRGKTIGVIRLAPDRIDKVLQDTGRFIANHFDIIVVYDKIDGVKRKRYVGKKMDIVREVGEVSQIVYQSIKKAQKGDRESYRIIREEKAIAFALKKAKKGDVVVHICNDDHKKSVAYVKKYLFGK